MGLIQELLWRLGSWTREHTSAIALAIVATLLVVYGNDINNWLKKRLRPYPMPVRILGFVLMCAFGYGAMTVFLTPYLAQWIGMISTRWLAPAVAGIFLLIGWLAEKRQQI